jgi:Fibronectin type III domain
MRTGTFSSPITAALSELRIGIFATSLPTSSSMRVRQGLSSTTYVGSGGSGPIAPGISPILSGGVAYLINYYSLPYAPIISSVTNVSSTSLTLSWENGGIEVGSGSLVDVTGYKTQYRRQTSRTAWSSWTTYVEDTNSTNTSIDISGLKPGSNYEFQVAAKNPVAKGYSSTASGPYSVSVAVTTPGGFYDPSTSSYVPLSGLKLYSGSSFVDPTIYKLWNGSSWVSLL